MSNVNKIFDALYQSLDRPNAQIQEAAFDALKTFVVGSNCDMNMVCIPLNLIYVNFCTLTYFFMFNFCVHIWFFYFNDEWNKSDMK